MSTYSHLLLDLDDTLYPSSSGVWEAVRDRIQSYIKTRLSLSEEEAHRLRARYLEQYGTTLAGLNDEFNIDTQDYLDYVHDVRLEELLTPDPGLGEMLASIRIPRIIFTNAYQPYAERVLDRLEIREHIDQIIDIYALSFHNKPKIKAYQIALKLIGSEDPEQVVFVDDRLANLEPAASLRMVTVMVGNDPGPNTHLHIEHINALTSLLPGLCEARKEG